MFSEKNIVITIGNYGTIVTLHSGRKTDEKFFEDLNDDAKSQLTEFFGRRKSLPIYILLDTIDQSYKKKIYPAIKISDLKRIAKRDMMSDGDSSSIKNYMLINNKSITKQANKRLECLFVSSSDSDMINKWIDFLIELQNHLIGIYMSPVESFNLFKLLKTNIKMQSKVRNKKNDLYCLVIQNKVSGIRQIVFSGQGIVFTRVVNYNFDQNDFLEKYEHDLYSTFEYLKRIYPSLAMAELDIINILPGKALDKLINNNNSELNLVNYTPNDVATKISYPSLASNDYCDTLVSKAFSEGKKILRFTIPKISSLEKFFLALNASYYINLVVVVGIFTVLVLTLFSRERVNQLIDTAESKRFEVSQNLNKLKRLAFEGKQIVENDEVISAEKIIEFGKIHEALQTKGGGFIENYIRLKFLKNLDVKMEKFSYQLNDFTAKSPSNNTGSQIDFSGTLFNKSGDIDDLFNSFDSTVGEVKKNFTDKQVKYTELPRNLDFNSKYPSYPFGFTVISSPTSPTPANPTIPTPDL